MRVLIAWMPNGDKWAHLPTLQEWLPRTLPLLTPAVLRGLCSVVVGTAGARDLSRALVRTGLLVVWLAGNAASLLYAVQAAVLPVPSPGPVRAVYAAAAVLVTAAVVIHAAPHARARLAQWALVLLATVLLRPHVVLGAVLWLAALRLVVATWTHFPIDASAAALFFHILGRTAFFSLGNSNRYKA